MAFSKGSRTVDLTRKIYPGKERFKLEFRTFFVDEYLKGYKRQPDDWYIMQEFTACTHVGTHIEAPLHHLKDGNDISEIPLEKVMGEALIMDFSGKEPETAIGLHETKEKAADLRAGDIALIRVGWDGYYNTPMYRRRPYFAFEAIEWLLDWGVKCIGVDSSGVEDASEDQPIHRLLCQRGIPVIEDLTNLQQLRKRRVFLIALPWKVQGLDASPTRVIAVEEE